MNRPQAAFALAQLAERFALDLRGDGSLLISGVGTLAAATPAQLSFLANPRYRGEMKERSDVSRRTQPKRPKSQRAELGSSSSARLRNQFCQG